MRAVLGLVALLLGVGLMVYLFAANAKTLVGKGSAGRQAQEQVAGIGLVTTEGTRYSDTVSLKGDYRDGKLMSLTVTDIDANGPIARKLGLQKGDKILEVGTQGGLQKVRDVNDEELAKSYVIEAPRGNWPVLVQRGAQIISTPATANTAMVPPVVAQSPAPPPSDDAGLGPATSDDTGLGAPAPTADASAPPQQQPSQPAPQPKQRPRNAYGVAQDLRDKISGGQGQQGE